LEMQALLTDIFSWIGGLWEWIAQRYSSSPGAGSRRAAAFIRFNAADGAGHVGWAFDFSDSDVNAGAVENPNGTPSCPVAEMDYWDGFFVTPIQAMSTRSYASLKYVNLTRANIIAACRVAKWISTQPYALFGRNCMDDTYDVLRAYGVPDLPAPASDLLPNIWFDGMEGTEVALAAFTWQCTGRKGLRHAFLAALAKSAPLKVPTWRQVGHKDWHDLQSQMAASMKGRQHSRPSP
jgi:hypothetical protein